MMNLTGFAFFCLLAAAEAPAPGEFVEPVEAPASGEFAPEPGEFAPRSRTVAAEEMSLRRSNLAWMAQSLGCFYGLLIPLAGLVVFAGACVVVAWSNRPAVIASYLVFVPVPLLIGMLGSIQGMISAFSVIAMSPTAASPSEIAVGISTALFTSLAGLLAMAPSYLVVAIGLLVRTLQSKQSNEIQTPFGSSILP